MYDDIVAHALEEAPNECCGVIASSGDSLVKVFRAMNKFASPLRYEIADKDAIRINREIDEAGWDYGAIYHSHTRSAPYPSQTDISLATMWAQVIFLIVGVAEGQPEVRAFRIVDKKVSELEVEVA
jgi:proteasome lid subunit RPN8/RPN11